MKHLIKIVVFLGIITAIAGCNLPTSPEAAQVVQNTEALVATSTAAPEPPAEPVEQMEPTETSVMEIVHVMKPAYGDGKAQTIHDQISDKTAPEKRAYGGDEFANGRYERPFLAENMEYMPYIDIVRADMFRDEDDVWAYVIIEVVNSPSYAGDKEIHYAVEIDETLDGRGNLMILVANPTDSEWTTDGVQIWRDINATIGSKTPIRPDESGGSDGYETLIFDEGKGDDADLAWVRKSDESNKQIEIAFKLEMIPETDEAYVFLWGAWAFAGDPHLAWFDHNDYFTLEEAGSPLIEEENYSLNEFEAADNTCRALSGDTPSGDLPGMCPYRPPATSGGTPPEGCVEVNCCPNGTAGCPFVWDPIKCECYEVVPELY